MAKIKIKDESGDKEFFTIVPNYIINHSSAIDRALYLEMKRYAGENGECFATSETMMKNLGIGRKSYNKSLNYLLKKSWITYLGLTSGKTRPIKTYKINNIWKTNVEYYKKKKISSKRTVSKDSVLSDEDTSQKNSKIPSERTVEEEPYKEEPLRRTATQSVAGKEVNELINSFSWNPTHKGWYNNTTQRKAAEELLKIRNLPELKKFIKVLPQANAQKYAPTTTTPKQLLDKWSAWESFFKKQKSENKKVAIII